MGNNCKTSFCEAPPHVKTCIKGLISCDCGLNSGIHDIDDMKFDDNCDICHGSAMMQIWETCGHCSRHCDAHNRETVDLPSVQNTLKMYRMALGKSLKKIKELEEKQKGADFKMDEKEFVATKQSITSLLNKLDVNNSDCNSRKKIYNEAKKIYKQQNAPVYIHKNMKQKIQSNQGKYKKANALPFTLTMDRDFKTFNGDKFKKEFALKLNIPIDAIKIISVTEGSTIVHTNLHAFEKNGTKYTVGAIAEKMCEKEAEKKLVEFGVFLAEFGEPINAFKSLTQQVMMNPKWNRIYGPGHVEWEGTLNDDKTEPYYCPHGWRKYTCKVAESSEDFDTKYKSWPIAYHGTKFSASMMITFSRLRAGGQPDVKNTSGADCFGTGVYFSPSIEYAAHPLYASPKKMSNNAKEHAGKWVQVVLNCRVKPGSFTVHAATIGDTSQQIDPNYKNNQLEWLIHAPTGTYLDESKVVFCGYMFRISDNDPRQLPSSKWWNIEKYIKYVIDVDNQWYEK
eukprot:129621_1